MNIVLTGGSGFIGSHLSQELLKNSENKLIIVDNLDDISEKTLVVLMYPVKKTLMERIESIITDTNSILYTPW